jgi:hypothetical protein
MEGAVLAHFRVVTLHLLGQTKENYTSLESSAIGRELNSVPLSANYSNNYIMWRLKFVLFT